MVNGFVIEVHNNSGQEKELCLFKEGGLPAGVLVNVINSSIDYDFLLNIASTKGLVGSGIMVDNAQIKFVTVYDGEDISTFEFDKLIVEKQVVMNGVDKYISLVIPAITDVPVLVQLLPRL
jgi:hypothetical protein